MLDGLALLKRLYIKQTFYSWSYIVLTWELASHGKQQVLVKAKRYVYFFEQLLGLWLDLLLVEQLLDLLLG